MKAWELPPCAGDGKALKQRRRHAMRPATSCGARRPRGMVHLPRDGRAARPCVGMPPAAKGARPPWNPGLYGFRLPSRSMPPPAAPEKRGMDVAESGHNRTLASSSPPRPRTQSGVERTQHRPKPRSPPATGIPPAPAAARGPRVPGVRSARKRSVLPRYMRGRPRRTTPQSRMLPPSQISAPSIIPAAPARANGRENAARGAAGAEVYSWVPEASAATSNKVIAPVSPARRGWARACR
jgi:hypothetical protein